MSLGRLRMHKSRSGSRQCINRDSLFDAPIDDAIDLQSPPQSRSIDACDSSNNVRLSDQSHSSSNIPQGSSNVQSKSGVKRTRGRSDPHKLIPNEGDPPYLLRISSSGHAVGDNATTWDSISGGHHGGYERGIGSGGHRRYMTTPVIHDYAMTQTQREATIQTEVKVKQLESSLDVEIRAREEQASMFTAQASKLAEQMAEMERRHQEEQEKSNAQMAEMHRYMSAFFSSSRGTSGS